MNRDILLCILIVVLCGVLLWITKAPMAALAGPGLMGARRRRFA